MGVKEDFLDANPLSDTEAEQVLKKNRYLKFDKYDPSDILAHGIIPEFKNEAEAFMCAKQVGMFIACSKTLYNNHDNFFKFLDSLKIHHAILCLKQIDLKNLELIMSKNKNITDLAMKIIV